MIVNGGTADVSGGLKIILGENSWGGINVDGVNGESSVNFAEGSKVTVQDTAGKDLDAIYIENGDANQVEINGAENAGLVQDENGNYVTDDTPEEPGETPEDPGDQNGSGDTDEGQKDPEQKPSGNDGDQNPSDNNAQADAEKEGVKSPKTGDSSALLLALSALAASGTAATVVLRKRNEMSR